MVLSRFDNVISARSEIGACISRFGFAPEHTYESFTHSAEEGWKSVFFVSRNGYGLMAYYIEQDKEWSVTADPLAPPGERGAVRLEFFEHAFSDSGIKSVYLECETETRKHILAFLPATLHAGRVRETLSWPVLNLHAYDTALPGARMKPMRNVRGRFLREHSLDITVPDTVPKPELHAIVDAWKKNRPATHRAYAAEYHALIDDNFTGTSGTSVFLVDGRPEALSGGWPVPNSAGYYHALALHTYRHWGLGEMLMLESLSRMKADGYAFANLGGSDTNLLAFKKKFGEISVYTTCGFSVVRR